MSDYKKQIIIDDQESFIPADKNSAGEELLQEQVLFDNENFVPDESEVKPTNKVTIYPEGVEIDLNNLEPVGTFNLLSGQIIFDEDEVDFVPDEPQGKPQEIKTAIVIDGPNLK